MQRFAKIFFAAVISLALNVRAADPLAWPDITREQKPWCYWWWMGSAVDKTNLTKELTRYRDAGYGGVHIIPIYGAKGSEANYISYLSPRWMEMLAHTVSEADKLGLGVDMTTGSGWCFGGGPNVKEIDGNALVVHQTLDVAAGGQLKEKFTGEKPQALVAFATNAAPVDLLQKIQPDGSVAWTAPAGAWKVYVVTQKFSGQKVKRPALGGEGPMLNLLYPDAMRHFLQPFTEAFASYTGPKPRAQYHDSYEYKTDWSPVFFKEFSQRRGYDLQNELPSLFATTPDDRAARVLCDYRETVSDIMVEDTLAQWVKWSHDHGFLTRNEAHGSPGNLLDLYAVADSPETEMFNKDRSKLISKFASSAAHVAGRKHTGSETGTWLAEHFTEKLSDMKYLVDDLFLSGVNRVYYHGTCYSPDEAAWPGWVFYASYEMNPRNAVWHDAPAFNAYVARCQAVLQSGAPDNDVLLYWPLHDFWSQPGKLFLPPMTVHARDWFETQPLGVLADKLWSRGWQFDYASDRQLGETKFANGKLVTSGNSRYRCIVVPPCEFIPLATLQKILALADAGATVIFADELPKDVPGFANLETRRAAFNQLLAKIKLTDVGESLSDGKNGAGRVLVGEVERALNRAGIAREKLVDRAGVYCIRRAVDGGRYYFIANRSTNAFQAWVPLATSAQSVVALDALSGKTGVAMLRTNAVKGTEVFLQLAAGKSIILRTAKEKVEGAAWPYADFESQPPTELTGAWRVEFISGGPTLPASYTTTNLASWAQQADPNAQAFAGTARYTLNFDTTNTASPTCLWLGKVLQSARVKLNGKDYGTLIAPPFGVLVDNLQPTNNVLEVEVTSTSANRIRDLDRRGTKWQIFNDINFVNQDYKKFDASGWPLADEGLLGPVSLQSVGAVKLAIER